MSKMYSKTVRLNESNKKTAEEMSSNMGISFNALMNVLIRSAASGGIRIATLTENGLRPDFEDSVIKASKEGGYMEFDSVDDMIAFAKDED